MYPGRVVDGGAGRPVALGRESIVATTGIKTRRWTCDEYDRLIEVGLLHEDDPIELVEGRLLVSEPQHHAHARAIELATDALRAAFGRGWRVRVQLPLALGSASVPEPDVAIVRGAPRDAMPGHPTRADLVIEVADTSLHLDRGLKARVYARAGIVEYWIVNLVDRAVEVHRGPRRTVYGDVRVARAGETLSPLAEPTARIAVEDLLP